jgi:CheY-like chemotaxis protein
MTALLVLFMFVAFAVIDLAVRMGARRMAQARARQARAAVLQTSVRVEYSGEAKSLKRVEVPDASARILAVDDEPVVLDSLRRILVLAGYSVDTVESGEEAIGLVQRHDYDFLFTDLKMPGMDGIEVVKAVKHLRPDIDVAVITGFATIESAVETMKYGASDYVQKPFTVDELTEFASKLLIRRQARLEASRRPSVRVAAPASADAAASHEYCVPGGAFISEGHVWARIEPSGLVRVGVDDFARKALNGVRRVTPVADRGAQVRCGDPVFELQRNGEAARFASPITGRIAQFNAAVEDQPEFVNRSPYDRGWICLVQPTDLARDLAALRIGKPVVEWYQEEIARLRGLTSTDSRDAEPLSWSMFEQEFLDRRVPARH